MLARSERSAGGPVHRRTRMTELGDEPGPAEHPDGPGLGHVDHDGIIGFPAEDEGDQAVSTSVGVLELTVVTADRDRGSRWSGHGTLPGSDRLSLPPGCQEGVSPTLSPVRSPFQPGPRRRARARTTGTGPRRPLRTGPLPPRRSAPRP